jgi:hypothetical protein
MADYEYAEADERRVRSHARELDVAHLPEHEQVKYPAPQEGMYAHEASLLRSRRLRRHGNEGTRIGVMLSAQRTYGNRAVQRALQRVQDKPDQDALLQVVENINSTVEFAKNVAGMALGESMPRGIGIGGDVLGEMMKRSAGGQGRWENLGGTLTRGLGALFGESKAFEKAVGASGTGFNVASLIGSGMKMLGALTGEKESEIGVGKVGEYVSTGATLASAPSLVKQGVQEGVMGLYNTAQGVADWAAGGGTDKLLQQGEEQLKGKSGSITQGYSMIANLAGAAATGSFGREANRIGEMADKGQLGALPLLGSKLGDKMFNLIGPAPKWLRDLF